MEKQSLIEQLKLKNPEIALYTVGDPAFSDYGQVLSFDTVSLEETASKLSTPESGVLYTAIEPTLESCPQMNAIQDKVFGELPIQLGYCRGYNNWLNAVEWHTSSEINIAVTPIILLLGKRQDIWDSGYDAGLIKGFLLEAGQAVEVYATSLHFTPCQVRKNGFGCIVGLPRGTNLPLERPSGDPLLFRKNKWLLAHVENKALIQEGVQAGIYGSNIRVKEV